MKPAAQSSRTVVVAGALANKPGNGGEAWVRLSWIQALEHLGFRVLFLEEIREEVLRDRQGRPSRLGASWNRSYFDQVVRAFGLEGRAALLVDGGREAHGLSLREVVEEAAAADLLVNIGGHLTLAEVRDRIPVRAYVDIDPGFTQIWEDQGIAGARLEGHHHHFTIGERIGTPGCPIPTLGIRWVPIRQPVLLEDWPPVPAPDPERFTTVASWRGSFGALELGGRTLGLKVHQFRRFMEVPGRAPGTFEIALAIHPDDGGDLEALRRHGWRITDPGEMCPDPGTFRSYIQGSGAEFSVAQGVYVETACGWFSDRTVRYLASGKPALVQDTGLQGLLPVGDGLITFRTLDEAAEGARRILREPGRHARAAREIARDHFRPEVALEPLLAETGVRP
jgi:hypothetical protein